MFQTEKYANDSPRLQETEINRKSKRMLQKRSMFNSECIKFLEFTPDEGYIFHYKLKEIKYLNYA
uniref:Uncharacterized protein n=1 Tax=Lepeophtheirus salmonis TaxID=72036 RepID=A0A0K2SZ66_LEPSM